MTTKLAPGPLSFPLIGGALQLRGDPLTRVTSLNREFGGVVLLGDAGGNPLFLVSSPTAVKHVLQENSKNYIKGKASQRMRPVLGDGLLLLEGEAWLRERRLVQPAFHRQKIGDVAETITAAAARLVEAWASKANWPFEIRDEMLRLTMELTVRNMFKADISGEIRDLMDAWQILFDDLSKNRFALASIPRAVPTPGNRRYAQAIETIDRTLFRLIENARRATTDDGSLLSLLVGARDEQGGPGLNDKQLRDELMTLFVGGYETSSNGLAFAFALLSSHPEIARRHRAELDRVLAGRPPTAADLANLPYTKQVVEETLRLYPPSWMITREALGPDQLDGFDVPTGAQILLSIYATHHDARLWPNPEGYDPERFRAGAERQRFSFFPFGGGARLCLGDQYALMEMQLVLATVLQRVRLDLLPGTVIAPRAMLGLRPRFPLMMTATAQ
ncbi:MAG: cytochrome P450 [Archangium sp.]|nr:cytochrome P450 [Archangium sp.]